MAPPDHLILRELIPDPDDVRRRLAVVLTEADLLRSQLRVSERLAHERQRLLRQRQQPQEAQNAR
jgi:hypothetical protein